MPSRTRPALLALSLVLTLAAPAVLASTASARPDPSGGQALLDKPVRGKAAVKALGADLDDAAAVNQMTPAHLATILDDPTAWVARDGRLFYTEDSYSADEVTTTAAEVAAATPTSGQISQADAFALHSKAGSAHTIFLDFDGYTLPAGSYWDTDGGMTGNTTYTGMSLDGTPAAFSPAELAYIETTWRIVAEKFAPFDIDVTTQAPAAGALGRSSSGDTTWGTRVVFTDDQDARENGCVAAGCAGVAWIGVFDVQEQSADQFEPAWAYTTLNFGGGDFHLAAGQAANTAAHEIGHTLGLEHDGTVGDPGGYTEGHDNWFPIMGSSDRAIGQFNTGEPTNQVNTDDLAVIAANTAGGQISTLRRSDDYTTTLALGSAESYSVDGIIHTAADSDTFSISRDCTEDMLVSATGIGLGQALDIKLTITRPNATTITVDPESGAVLTGDPDTPSGVDAITTVAGAGPGTWTFKVEGIGSVANGYTDYGSLGHYTLAIDGCAGAVGTAPGAPASVTATPNARTSTGNLSWTAPADNGGGTISNYVISGLPSGNGEVAAAPLSRSLTGLTPGVTYTVGVAAKNEFGTGAATFDTVRIDTWVPTTAPQVSASVSGTTATASWPDPTSGSNPGKAVLTGWTLEVLSGGVPVDSAVLGAGTNFAQATGLPVGSYQFRLTASYAADDQTGLSSSTASFTVSAPPAPTIPTAPKIGTPASGVSGSPSNATARWSAPTSDGGSAITGYKVVAYKLTASGNVASAVYSKLLPATARSYKFALATGRYKFKVIAFNGVGKSPASAYSAIVTAR